MVCFCFVSLHLGIPHDMENRSKFEDCLYKPYFGLKPEQDLRSQPVLARPMLMRLEPGRMMKESQACCEIVAC